MEADGLGDIGHAGFRLDAQIMSAILYDYLTNPVLRQKVAEEHTELRTLLGEYHNRLREVYAPEISEPSSDDPIQPNWKN